MAEGAWSGPAQVPDADARAAHREETGDSRGAGENLAAGKSALSRWHWHVGPGILDICCRENAGELEKGRYPKVGKRRQMVARHVSAREACRATICRRLAILLCTWLASCSPIVRRSNARIRNKCRMPPLLTSARS